MASKVRAQYYNDFFSKMTQHRSSGRFCDVKIRVGEEVFNCHTHILSLASDYFDGMLGGNFGESSSQEVVLEGIDACVFEVMLNFIYTGEAKIHTLNLYDVIRAADFYQLPNLVELCGGYIQENLNALAENIWDIFLYAQSVRIEPIVGLLKRHIRENFGYFSNAPEFIELSIDSLLEILRVVDEEGVSISLQDLFFEGIYTWIRHQVNLNPDEKKSYSDRLCNEIDFTHLSAEYTRDWLPKRKAVLASLSESTDRSTHTPGVVQSCPKLLRAYVSIIPKDQNLSMGTMIFSGFSASDPSSWMYSGKVVDCFSDYMKNVVIGDHLYTLGFTGGPYCEDREHTFRCSNSFTMYPYTSLSLPPFVTDKCDMCGTSNDIYLYDKYAYWYHRKPDEHLYFYKRDIDRWFPLPSPKFNVSLASMVYDEGRLYLVGGLHFSRLIQAYDLRTRGWTKLPPTMKNYFTPDCFIYGKEICIIDRHQLFGEIYDPTSGKSRSLTKTFENDLRFCPYLENFADIFLQKGSPYDETITRFYMTPDQHGWIPLPNLSDSVAKVEGNLQDVRHRMLNVFTF